MAASLTFQREWVVQFKEMLNDDPLPKPAVILRVPTPLLKTNPEAYIPQFLSFGPYHHSKLEKDIDAPCAERKISTAEVFKHNYAAKLSQELRKYGKSFKVIVERMKQKRREIESFYHWPTCTEGEDSENFALMMAIDSSFLLQFLTEFSIGKLPLAADGHSPGSPCLTDEMDSLCKIYSACLRNDIMKMENQIPLLVLKEVFEYAKEALALDPRFQDFNELLPVICRISPFALEINIGGDKMAEETHYLGCMHASISLALHMQAGGGEVQRGERGAPLHHWFRRFLPTVPETERLFPNGMSAVQLERAGIKFKPFSNLPENIRLDKVSGTLYLPPIFVSDIGTEVILRNMLALEFNDALRSKCVTSYVALMGMLIQSPEDVRILVDRRIIFRGAISLTDEGMVKMWNDVRQPFLGVSTTDLHYDLYFALTNWYQKNYLKIKLKSKVCGLFDYMSSWKFIAPLAGFLGLAMIAIQTYCSVCHC